MPSPCGIRRAGCVDRRGDFLICPVRGVLPLRTRATRRYVHRLAFMYRCPLCQCVVPSRTPCHRVVLRRCPKEYPYRPRANVVVVRSAGKKPRREYRDDPGGRGQEIVEEVLACPDCAAGNRQT